VTLLILRDLRPAGGVSADAGFRSRVGARERGLAGEVRCYFGIVPVCIFLPTRYALHG